MSEGTGRRARRWSIGTAVDQFFFGRQQDFAYQQEVDGSPEKRHHVRFWRCPDGWLLPGGRRSSGWASSR